MAVELKNVTGLTQMLTALEALPSEVLKRGGPVAYGLKKGAEVIVREAKKNVKAIIAQPNKGGKDNVSTGALLKNITRIRSRHPKDDGFNEQYIVKVKKAPKVRNRTPAQYGRILEFGSERETAKPWMTPAYFSKREEALRTVVSATQVGIDKAIKAAALIGMRK